jgi:hypothetical protein
VSGGRLRAFFASCLLVVIALAVAYPERMVSPGRLMQGHAAIERDCFACHAPGRGAASERCIGCHAVADIGLRIAGGAAPPQRTPKIPFHQELIERDCLACHDEHAGPNAAPSLEAFSHALLRPAARGLCDLCHAAPADELHRSVTGTCSPCHVPQHWKPATFDHDQRFVLDTDHNAPCATCHEGGDLRRASCYGCHAHQPEPMRATHLEEGIRDLDRCARCHRSAGGEAEGGDS